MNIAQVSSSLEYTRIESSSDQEQEQIEIEEILERGYNQLYAFLKKLHPGIKESILVELPEYFNAESLMDYLANYHSISVSEIDEFQLRWFIFSHYIRKSMTDRKTAEQLLNSLDHYLDYVFLVKGVETPFWIADVLDDSAFYIQRLDAYEDIDTEDETQGREAMRVWNDELQTDLEARCLWLPRDMAEGMQWEEQMGWREATLHKEANMLWQSERREYIQIGMDYEGMYDHLKASYYIWLDTPQERLEDRTPRDLIMEERESLPELDEGDED